MIEVKNVTKRFGTKTALSDISFKADEGCVLGFLGPNGAGKSTAMNIITGYISSTSGSVKVGGADILGDPIKAKMNIGYLPEHPPLYPDMTVNEYLNFVYDLKRVKLPRRSHLNEITELVKITDVRGRLIRNLSKGYGQRVGFAQALIGNPRALVLDEPTVGLDPKQIIEIRTLIKRLGEHHTVILSSHILPEIQAVCDRVIIINKGHIVANDKTSVLAANLSTDHKLRIQAEGNPAEVTRLLEGIPGMRRVIQNRETEPGVHEYELEANPNLDLRRDVSKKLAARNVPILMMRSNELTLEEVFLKITTGGAAAFNGPETSADSIIAKSEAETGENAE